MRSIQSVAPIPDRRRRRPFFLLFGAAWFCLLAANSCTEPREGCLDIEATNFDASADKSCCCSYPALQLLVQPRFDSLVWKPDTAYEYVPGKWLRLREAVFYLSDFQLIQQGVPLVVSDTVGLAVWGNANDTIRQTFTDDVQMIRRSSVNYALGEFRTSGAFETIRFRLGVPEPLQAAIPGLAPENHPLRIQPERLWLGRDTGYAALKLVFTRDTLTATPADTIWLARPDFGGLDIQQDGPFAHESGFDFTLRLTADYKTLFQGVDLSTGDKSVWKQQIIVNLPQFLRVTP